ncbi:MAG: DNA mismatch repair protein MutS, partial [Deltaproteobacteria bacterium]|nr:DNA mismatch repair protein MutS [Deltaproteobacteria bacterium]
VKGIVPREVVRVLTPALVLDEASLDARANSWLLGIAVGDGGAAGLAAYDLSTGELCGGALDDAAGALAVAVRFDPREVLLAEGAASSLEEPIRTAVPRCAVRTMEAPATSASGLLDEVLGAAESRRARSDLGAFGTSAAALVLAYARAAQPNAPIVVSRIGPLPGGDTLLLDPNAQTHLELLRSASGDREGSLLWLLDETKTSMGARLLRRWVLFPLASVGPMRRRHDAVDALVRDPVRLSDVRRALAKVGDIERLVGRAVAGVATPRDLGGLRDALLALPDVVTSATPATRGDDGLSTYVSLEDTCADVASWLASRLVDSPPMVASGGGIFREAVDPRLDELRNLSTNAKDVLLELEERERKRTGIATMKVRYNKVFGYYIELSKTQVPKAPADWRRKQTVAGGERFTTAELEALQGKILNADERAKALEQDLFAEMRARVASEARRVVAAGSAIAQLDVIATFAELALKNDYVRPEVDDGLVVELVDARHPVVEKLAAAGRFVPNDTRLDVDAERLLIVTGPNMAGQSTIMRQVALAVVMAQAGSFVAAKRAHIGIVDKVFTRVGASDDLSRGQSTFMVEMSETASILRGATRRSLVVMDEIGRGTSTYDGLAIAWAVAEHLHDVVGARTLFATHYHELCDLAATHAHVANYNVAAKERDGQVVLLHRLVPGGTNRSYGVAVARLAGVPEVVLARARAILEDLERGAALPGGTSSSLRAKTAAGRPQLDLFVPAATVQKSAVEETLRNLAVERLTPLDALVALAKLKGMLP